MGNHRPYRDQKTDTLVGSLACCFGFPESNPLNYRGLRYLPGHWMLDGTFFRVLIHHEFWCVGQGFNCDPCPEPA